MSITSPKQTLAFSPWRGGCKQGVWIRKVSPSPPPLPISLYRRLQIRFGYCLIFSGHRLWDASLYDKFLLSSKCDPSLWMRKAASGHTASSPFGCHFWIKAKSLIEWVGTVFTVGSQRENIGRLRTSQEDKGKWGRKFEQNGRRQSHEHEPT